MRCIFCSHKNNPEGIEAYKLPHLSFEEIKDISEFLDGSRKIVIGESASRIIEGEPFLRDDIIEILKYLRRKFAATTIGITTNGIFLTEEIVKSLKTLEPVEINLSLNSSTEQGRGILFRLKDNSKAVNGVKYLNKYNVPFNGSIVAMPGEVGYRDIKETISFLCLNNAITVRVFVPGFSRLSRYNVNFMDVRRKLHEMADEIYEKYGVPILVEPPEIKNLNPEIHGIVKGSPASISGILKGDIILKIEDYIPSTRVDAYYTLNKKANPKVQFKRGNSIMERVIQKGKGISSGAVFYYDIHPDIPKSIIQSIRRYNSKKPVIITSELGLPIIKLSAEKFIGDIDIIAVKNNWFGGSIMCTGLLTVGDIIHSLWEWCKNADKPDLIILPESPFDMEGKDLCGRSCYEIEESLGIKTIVIE